MAWPPHLTLRGSHSEAGLIHGEVLRDQIHALFDIRMSLVCDLTKARKERVQEVCEAIANDTESLLPGVFSETVATSRAADIDVWKLVLAGGFSDVLDRCGAATCSNRSANECSLIVTRDSDGEPLLVGTWDTHGSAQGALVTFERQMDDGPAVIALSTAGWPMQQGVTEFGLAFAIANMGAVRNYDGISYIGALPDIVASRDVREACRRASRIPHCSARFYKFVDRNGDALGLEHEGRHAFTLSGFDAHTNHFVSPDGASLEGRPSVVEESNGRRKLMNALFSSETNSIEEVFRLLRTANEGGYSIMKLGEGSEDRTCAAFAISPSKHKLWFTAGPPEFNKIQELSIHGSIVTEEGS